MKRVVNYGTFKVDHIVRSFEGSNLGRAIMFDEHVYRPGTEVINVSVLRVPVRSLGDGGIRGFQCYVDGILYEVSKGLNDVSIIKRGDSWIVTNVCLRRVDVGEEKQD